MLCVTLNVVLYTITNTMLRPVIKSHSFQFTNLINCFATFSLHLKYYQDFYYKHNYSTLTFYLNKYSIQNLKAKQITPSKPLKSKRGTVINFKIWQGGSIYTCYAGCHVTDYISHHQRPVGVSGDIFGSCRCHNFQR
jgi:hypothetical protein